MDDQIKSKTNWKFILIILILAILVGGGILGYLRYFKREMISLTKFPEIKKPEKIEDETANWKTYRNEEYKFEVKYPPDWGIDKERSFATDFRPQEMEKNYVCISIRFDKFFSSSIEEYLKKAGDEYALSKARCLEEKRAILVNIGGQEAFRCENLPDPFPSTATLISIGNFIYQLEKVGTEICRNFNTEKIFNQILSTFRFLE